MSEKKSLIIGVTGSTGVLGRAFVQYWQDKEDEKVEFVRFKGDIQNAGDIVDWLKNTSRFDGLFHFAALVPTVEVDKDPARACRINTLGTLNLLEACRQHYGSEKCPWIFLASTSHVYRSSSREEDLVNETARVDPVSTYGLTKAQGDAWADVYRDRHKLPICTGRIFSYSAPNQAGSFFIPSLITKIKNADANARLEMRGLDGTRDFLTVQQIVGAMQHLFGVKAVGIFNIGTGTAIKLLDIAQAMKKRLGRDDVSIVSTGTDTNHLAADATKLNSVGYRAVFDMNMLLDSFLG